MSRQTLVPILLPADPTAAMEAATKQYVDTHLTQAEADALYVNVAGDAMTGALNMQTNMIQNLPNPSGSSQPVTLSYADTNYVNVAGDTMSGGLTVNGNVDVNGLLEANATTVTQLTTTSGPVTSGTNVFSDGYQQAGGDPASTTGVRAAADGKITTTSGAGTGTMMNFRRGGAPAVDEIYIRFMTGGAPGTEGGKIRHKSGPAVDYATTSDYRLKTELAVLREEPDTMDRLRALRPIRFTMNADQSGEVQDGFFAHEVAEVIPSIVSGEKDQVAGPDDPDYPEGTPIPQSLDYGKLTPLLVAALQRALDRIDILEARINALETP